MFAPSATSSSAINQCLQVMLVQYQSPPWLPLSEEFSLMRWRNNRAATIQNSSTTIAIMRGCRAYFAIVVRTTHRNQPCPAKRRMRLAQVVINNSSRVVRRMRFVRSVIQTRRVVRSKPFHRCAVSTPDSITRNMPRRVLRAPLATGATATALG